MKIVVTGGGSGGHITPILAVAAQLKTLQPGCQIIYIGQRGDSLADIPANDSNVDQVYTVWAGKLRRYADEGWSKRLRDVQTQALNIRDISRLVRGVWQSFWLLRKLQPDVVFSRGGFVSVPVALGARLNGIPYITHDSDSVPSLANRLIARWATIHAVALPKELYPYSQEKTITVGVPAGVAYVPVTSTLQQGYRTELGLGSYKQVVLLTGGGNGSQILNDALVANARYLLATYPDLVLLHITGRIHEAETMVLYDSLNLEKARARVLVKAFVTDLYRYSGAADVIIARAGASTLAEFALQAKACVIIPAPQLVGDHQTKNAKAMAERGAIVQLSEDQLTQPERLGRTVGALLEDTAQKQTLGRKLSEYAHPQAAAELAALILKVGGGEDARPKN